MDIFITTQGRITWRSQAYRCAIGKGGIRNRKAEGDGATPAGTFLLKTVYYRADRIEKPHTGLTLRAIKKLDGWCDDPNSPNYNRLISLPFIGSHEKLWRADDLYDILVTIGFNDTPPVKQMGSAIFLHIAKPDYLPTNGCIAISRDTISLLLKDCVPGDRLCVKAPPYC